MRNELLSKTAEYIKLAVNEVSSLHAQNQDLQEQVKVAHAIREQFSSSMEETIKKIADTLYEADFITDKFTYNDFIKKAEANPSYLANVFNKVCDAKDVGTMGKSVKVKVASFDNLDPIMNRAFGLRSNPDLLDDIS